MSIDSRERLGEYGGAYGRPGEALCGDPQPFDGPPCQRYPGHGKPHARPVSGGVDAWWPIEEGDEA